MKLYVYEHCPYCIRVRVALAIKNIKCEIKYLHDDDIEGHTDKIGVKNVPILEKDDGTFMGESLDIIAYIDNLDGMPIFTDAQVQGDIQKILSEVRHILSPLVFSYTHMLNFPELETASSREYYINRFMNKIPYDRLEDVIADRENLKKQIKPYLDDISKHIKSSKFIDGKKLSMNEILLFPLLHCLTAVENLDAPIVLKEYLETVGEQCDLKPFYKWA